MNNTTTTKLYQHPVTGDVLPLEDWLDTKDDYILVYEVTKNIWDEWVPTGDYYEAYNTSDNDGEQ